MGIEVCCCCVEDAREMRHRCSCRSRRTKKTRRGVRQHPLKKNAFASGEYKLSRNIALYDLEIIKITPRAWHPF
jgi:hypothetical protein